MNLLNQIEGQLKSFYMSKCETETENASLWSLTESVDVLMPGVGEIVGGSMRECNYQRLLNGFIDQQIVIDGNQNDYYWYTDLRKHGSIPHGGFGLGLERFLCWMLDIHHIRDACLYPRYSGRCKP
jgi:asparaginyl-tRNA synthetase